MRDQTYLIRSCSTHSPLGKVPPVKSILAVTVVLFILTGCSRNDDWTAFVFPDQSAIPNATDVDAYRHGKYPSLKACQAAAVEAVRASDISTGMSGDYECGFKCTPRAELGGLLVCKTTEK
jgi:hypothetical protein